MQEQTKLTDEQTRKVNEESQLLMVRHMKLYEEQVQLLEAEVWKDKNLDEPTRMHLLRLLKMPPVHPVTGAIGQCTGMRITVNRLTKANALQKENVQVVYSFEDELYDYLRRADSILPKKLRGWLDGGMVLAPQTQKPTAEDNMPLTGKTKTGRV